MALQWRIYYGDGQTFSSSDGPPERSAGWNVQAIVVPDKTVGRKVIREFDYYYYQPAEELWFGTRDFNSIIEKMAFRIPIAAVSVGRWIAGDLFDAIIKRAMNDPGFPRRSGHLPESETPG